MVTTFNPANPFNLAPNPLTQYIASQSGQITSGPNQNVSVWNPSSTITSSAPPSTTKTIAPKIQLSGIPQTTIFRSSSPAPSTNTTVSVSQKPSVSIAPVAAPKTTIITTSGRGPGEYYNPITKQGMSSLIDPGVGFVKQQQDYFKAQQSPVSSFIRTTSPATSYFTASPSFLSSDVRTQLSSQAPKVNINLPSNATAADVVRAGNVAAAAAIQVRKDMDAEAAKTASTTTSGIKLNIREPGLLPVSSSDANALIYSQFPGLTSSDVKTKTEAAQALYQQLSSTKSLVNASPSWDMAVSTAFAQRQDDVRLDQYRKEIERSIAKTMIETKAKSDYTEGKLDPVDKAYFELKKAQVGSPKESFAIAMDPNLTQTTKIQIALGLIPANREFATAVQDVQAAKKETKGLETLVIENKTILDNTQAGYDKFVLDAKPKFDEYNKFLEKNTLYTKPDGTPVLSPENYQTLTYIAERNDLKNLSNEWQKREDQLNSTKDTFNIYADRYNATINKESTAVDNVNRIADRLNAPGEAFKTEVSKLDPYQSLALAKYGFTPYAARESVTGATPVLREEARIYEKEWRDPSFFDSLGAAIGSGGGFDAGKVVTSGAESTVKYYTENPIMLVLGPASAPFAAANVYQDYSKTPDKYLQQEFMLAKQFDTSKLTSGKYEDLPEVYRQSSQIRRIEDFYRPFDAGKAGEKIVGYTASGAGTGALIGGISGAMAGGVGAIPGAAAGATTGAVSGFVGSFADIAFSETLGRSTGSRRAGEAAGLVAGIGTSILTDIAITPVLNPILIGKSKPQIERLRPPEEFNLKITKTGEDTFRLKGSGTEYTSNVQFGTGLYNKGIDYSGSAINPFKVNLTFKNTANVPQPFMSVATIKSPGALPEATLKNMKVGDTIAIQSSQSFDDFVREAAIAKTTEIGQAGTKVITSNNERLTKFLKDLSDDTFFDIKGNVKYINADTGKATTTLIKESTIVAAEKGSITSVPTTVQISQGGTKASTTQLTSAEKALQSKLSSMKPGELGLYKLTPDEELLMQSALQKQMGSSMNPATSLTPAEKAFQTKLNNMSPIDRGLYNPTVQESALMESALRKMNLDDLLNSGASSSATIKQATSLTPAEKAFQTKLNNMSPIDRGLYTPTAQEAALMESALQKQALKDTLSASTKQTVGTNLDNLQFDLKAYSNAPSGKGRWNWYKTPEGQAEYQALLRTEPTVRVTSQIYNPIKDGTAAKITQKQSFLQLGKDADIYSDLGANLYYSDIGLKTTAPGRITKTTLDKADDLFSAGKISADEYAKILDESAKVNTSTSQIGKITLDKADDLFSAGKISADEYAKILQDSTKVSTSTAQIGKMTVEKADEMFLAGKLTPDEFSKILYDLKNAAPTKSLGSGDDIIAGLSKSTKISGEVTTKTAGKADDFITAFEKTSGSALDKTTITPTGKSAIDKLDDLFTSGKIGADEYSKLLREAKAMQQSATIGKSTSTISGGDSTKIFLPKEPSKTIIDILDTSAPDISSSAAKKFKISSLTAQEKQLVPLADEIKFRTSGPLEEQITRKIMGVPKDAELGGYYLKPLDVITVSKRGVSTDMFGFGKSGVTPQIVVHEGIHEAIKKQGIPEAALTKWANQAVRDDVLLAAKLPDKLKTNPFMTGFSSPGYLKDGITMAGYTPGKTTSEELLARFVNIYPQEIAKPTTQTGRYIRSLLDATFGADKVKLSLIEKLGLGKEVTSKAVTFTAPKAISKSDDFIIELGKVSSSADSTKIMANNIDDILLGTRGTGGAETIIGRGRGGAALMMEPAKTMTVSVPAKTTSVPVTMFSDTVAIAKMQPGVQAALAQAVPMVEAKAIPTYSFAAPITQLKTEGGYAFTEPVLKLDYAPLALSEKLNYSPVTIQAFAAPILKTAAAEPIEDLKVIPQEKIIYTPIETVKTEEKISVIEKTNLAQKLGYTDPFLTAVPGFPLVAPTMWGWPFTPKSSSGAPTGARGRRKGTTELDKKKKKGLIQVKSSLFRKFAFGEKDFLISPESLGAFRQKIAQKGSFFGYDVIPTQEQVRREEQRLLKSKGESKYLKEKSYLGIRV